MCPGTPDILLGKALIEADRHVDSFHDVGWAAGKPTAPDLAGHELPLVRAVVYKDETMPKVLNFSAQILAALVLVAVLTIAPAPLSSAADSGIDKLKWHEEPLIVPDTPFQDCEGNILTMSDFAGKVLVVNLWATWCAPCIREMPTLNALEEDLGGEFLHVIALSQDREGASVARPFIETNGWSNLALYVSDVSAFALAANIRGLPTTLIVAADGREVARLEGTAEWNSADVKKVLTDLMQRQN